MRQVRYVVVRYVVVRSYMARCGRREDKEAIVTLREELERIYGEHGSLTPEIVVTVARSPDHPLHNRFEWDDGIAAEAFRKTQARNLIRSVRIVYRAATDQAGESTVRAYHAVRDARGSTYEPAGKVAADPLLRKIVLAEMERDWLALKRRYEHFAEFAEMVRRDLRDGP